jgi:hypothetical protein
VAYFAILKVVEMKNISPVEPIDPRRSETPKRLLAGLRLGSSSAGRRPRGQGRTLFRKYDLKMIYFSQYYVTTTQSSLL